MTDRRSQDGVDGQDQSEGKGHSALRFSAWNYLLLLPLLMLITAFYNQDGPRLFGLPFFYWFQMAFVVVGVTCVALVYAKTKHIGGRRSAPPGEQGSDSGRQEGGK